MKALTKLLPVAGIVSTLFLGSLAHAEFRISSIAGGVNSPTPMGDNYQIYSRSLGGLGAIWVQNDQVFGSALQLHGSVTYQPYKVNNVSNVQLKQWLTMVGIETKTGEQHFINPFFSLDIGAAYSSIDFGTGVSGGDLNSSTAFAAQARGGFYIPLFSSLAAQVAAPITAIFSSSKFVSLNGEFSLRWSL